MVAGFAEVTEGEEPLVAEARYVPKYTIALYTVSERAGTLLRVSLLTRHPRSDELPIP